MVEYTETEATGKEPGIGAIGGGDGEADIGSKIADLQTERTAVYTIRYDEQIDFYRAPSRQQTDEAGLNSKAWTRVVSGRAIYWPAGG